MLLLSFLIDYNKVPMRNLIGEKSMFYESIKHGAKAVKSSANHTIVSRRDWLSNGVVFKTDENGGKGNLGILFVLNFAIFARQYFTKLYFRDFYGGK